VGGTNTVFSYAVFAALYWLLGDALHYMGALALAYVVGILLGFSLHRRLVFRVTGTVLADLLRFTTVQLTAFAANAALLTLLVEVVGLPVLFAQVMAVTAVIVASYFGHLLFSFRRPRTEPGALGSSGGFAGGDDDRGSERQVAPAQQPMVDPTESGEHPVHRCCRRGQ
jgi:putative flippase GtrA